VTRADLRTANLDYLIILTCGCTLRLRNQPLHQGVRYGCSTGQGHGYRLAWVSWVNAVTGQSAVNVSVGAAR